jgi:hypothetical protein
MYTSLIMQNSRVSNGFYTLVADTTAIPISML